MHDKVYNVLFICNRNSARSIIAEGLLNAIGRGRFRAWSAGHDPAGIVHPLALQTLGEMQLAIDGFRSKHWNEFTAPGAPAMDLVFTVCDTANDEPCPSWPGQPITARWGIADPQTIEGTPAQQAKRFRDTAVTLKRRIELMMALPIALLDPLSLQRKLDSIGASTPENEAIAPRADVPGSQDQPYRPVT